MDAETPAPTTTEEAPAAAEAPAADGPEASKAATATPMETDEVEQLE